MNSARDVETDTPTPSSATVLNCSPSSVPILIVQQMNSLQNRMDDINRRLASLQAGLGDKNNAIIATLNREIEMLKARVQELSLLNAPTRPNCDKICSGQKAESSPSPVHKPLSDSSSSLNVVTWNCRGLNTADPYLSEFAATNDIIVIQEHWLWPHSLCKLDKLLDGFLAYGCSDKRLTENSDTSLSLVGVNAGCGAHADDIRTCTIGAVGVERQAAFLQSLTSENSLRLNMTKTEIVHLARHPVPTENVNINNTQIETKKEAKCLGVWWTQDLSSCKSVEENISKARRAFFALGAIDIFQGACNPLTALSLFNTFVLPILLYGCEIWSLNDPLLEKLESFQGEIGKRILSLPKYYNNLSVKIALKWPSFRVLVLIRKLSYLAKLLSQEPTSTHVRLFHSLASANALDIALVRQCKELEISYGTQFWETSI